MEEYNGGGNPFFYPKTVEFVSIISFLFIINKDSKLRKEVALQFSYFSKVSARLSIILHEQAVCVKRMALLFGCTVCSYQMVGSVAGILGI